MSLYSVPFNNSTTTTSNDLVAAITPATGAGSLIKLKELYIGGGAASSAVVNLSVGFSASPGTPVSITPGKLDQSSAAATFTAAWHATATWSASIPAAPSQLLLLCFNAYAGVVRWVAPPNGALICGGQGAIAILSARPSTGSAGTTVSGHMIIEQA